MLLGSRIVFQHVGIFWKSLHVSVILKLVRVLCHAILCVFIIKLLDFLANYDRSGGIKFLVLISALISLSLIPVG